MSTRVTRALSLLLALALALPAVAAASGDDVVRDCADDGRLSKRYSQREYRDALRDIPTDVDEYTDCRDIIRDARLGAAGGGSGGTGGGGGGGAGTGGDPDATAGAGGLLTDPLKDASDAERNAIRSAVTGGGKAVAIGGKTITPGDVGATGTGGSGDVPAPLALALILLAVAAAAGAAATTRRLIGARRRGPDPGTA